MPRLKKLYSSPRVLAAAQYSGGSHSFETSFIPFAGTYVPGGNGHSDMSLRAEALNTQHHNTSWTSDQRLRHTRVNFVSARDVESTGLTVSESAMADMSLETPPEQVDEHPFEQLGVSHHRGSESFKEHEQSGGFFIDTTGSLPITTSLPPPKLRSVSPTPSNSSDEVILFGGRDEAGRGVTRTSHISRTSFNVLEPKVMMKEGKLQNQLDLLSNGKHADFKSYRDQEEKDIAIAVLSTAANMKVVTVEKKQKRGSRRRGQHLDRRQRVKDEALIADYIANMDDEDQDSTIAFGQRELGGADSDLWQDTDVTSGEPAPVAPNSNSWDQPELGDLDDLSTSDEIKERVHSILSKRDRPSGPQYLVERDGHAIHEAKWVAQARLTDAVALAHIKKFEAEERLVVELSSETDDRDSESEGESTDEGHRRNHEVDEENLVQVKINSMSDKHIARLLAKQEELGMGSSELLLFNESGDAEDDDLGSDPYSIPRKTREGQGDSKRPRGDFPIANILADAYDGFDIMDFERPSLKRKPKGRKGKLAFDLSDSELEASMQMSRENDRKKKKEKKEARQELRAQGFLGQKNQKADLKSKYKEGMGIHAVKDEIKIFLMGNNTTLALPPMNKADRKVVHELANAFHLKSKSVGSGQKRFPVLYRTLRTSSYVESIFDAVESKITRRFLPRMDLKSKRGPSVPSRSNRGGFSTGGVSYRDGDVVGGSAPELGVENKGRAMLEKMGWSTGTALGALNNKGILEPVTHVVKTTKAGLG